MVTGSASNTVAARMTRGKQLPARPIELERGADVVDDGVLALEQPRKPVQGHQLLGGERPDDPGRHGQLVVDQRMEVDHVRAPGQRRDAGDDVARDAPFGVVARLRPANVVDDAHHGGANDAWRRGDWCTAPSGRMGAAAYTPPP